MTQEQKQKNWQKLGDVVERILKGVKNGKSLV